eukprot:gb/GECH01005296.1/.p1 GENE.gb/GECH01005296.1/~~gb/GECH01005296.1/.p1  ORF type:complete len:1239 (+),score=289.74 gb/GECH01005296.1/:1-3717(+)
MNRSSGFLFLLLSLFLFSFSFALKDADVFRWAKNVEDWLTQVMNQEVDLSQIQSAYDNSDNEIKNYNGSQLVLQIANELENMFRAKEEAVLKTIQDSKNFYQQFNDINSSLNIPSNTFFADDIKTHPDDLYFNRDFVREVTDFKSSVKIPSQVRRDTQAYNSSIVWTEKLESKWQQLYQNDTELRWQYFGTDSGVFRIFPGHEWTRTFVGFPSDFDHRFRPWYLSSSSGPKRVVAILDASRSMEGRPWDTAKATASHILNSLTQSDYFALLVINQGTCDNPTKFKIQSCNPEGLIRATGTHVRQALESLDYINTGGASDPFDAFDTGLSFLSQPPAEECLPAIVYLSDAKSFDHIEFDTGFTEECHYDEEKTIDLVNSKISEMSPSPRIFSFYLKIEESANREDPKYLARHLSCDTGGIMTEIDYDQSLLDQIKPYLNFFTQAQKSTELIWTSPYVDASGLGVLITAAVPLFDENTDGTPLIGVAGVDFVLSKAENLVRSYQWGNAYAFLINDSGEAIIHPRVKNFENSQGPPFFMDISALETKNGSPEGFEQVRIALLNGETGSKTLETLRERQQGGAFSGMRQERITQTYYYTKIEGTPFSLALVLEDPEDIHHKTLVEPETVDFSSYYHRLDLVYEESVLQELDKELDVIKHPDKYKHTYISRQHSTVKLAPRAFCNANEYVQDIENGTSVQEMQTVINMPKTASSGCNSNDRYQDPAYTDLARIRSGVRTDIKLSHIAEYVWKNQTDDRIVWRYLGTNRGVFRIYPGTPSNKTFDPTERVWYQQSLGNKNRFTISTPYIDALGAGRITTISKTIAELSTNRSEPNCSGKPGCPCQVNSDCQSQVCHPLQKTCSTGRIQAVVGVDVNYDQFDEEFYKMTGCNDIEGVRCYLMDKHGLLVWAPQFKDAPYPLPHDGPSRFYSFKNTFIGRREPGLARDLIYNKKLLQRSGRIKLQSICDTSSAQYRRTLRIQSTLDKGVPEDDDEDNDQNNGDSDDQTISFAIKTFFNISKRFYFGVKQLTFRLIIGLLNSLQSGQMKKKNDEKLNTDNYIDFEKESTLGDNSPEHYDDYHFDVSETNDNFWDQPMWIINPTIPPYDNKTTCPHRIVYYNVDDSVIPEDSQVMHGNFSGSCSNGDYKIAKLKNSNLYFIVIENLQEKPKNFQCQYVSSAVYDIGKYFISNVCDVSRGGRHAEGRGVTCPAFDNSITLQCSASSISIYSALFILFVTTASLLSLEIL